MWYLDGNSGGSMVRIYPEEQKIVGYCKNANHSVPSRLYQLFCGKIQLNRSSLMELWKND